MSYNKFSIEKENQIIEMYERGLNTKEIGVYFNTFNTSIRRVLLRRGINIRPSSEAQRISRIDIFTSPELTREESYFLGLLITDGCISNQTVSVSLKEEDSYLVEKFATFLGEKVTAKKYINKKYGTYQVEARTKNPILTDNIQKLANFVNKSYEAKLFIPLNYDILRGIIDGDGCIAPQRNDRLHVNICSASKEFTLQIKEFLNSEGIDCTITTAQRKAPLYIISINKQEQVKILYERMYDMTDLFLIRKKDKYGSLLRKLSSTNP